MYLLPKDDTFVHFFPIDYCGFEEVSVSFDKPGVVHTIPMYPFPYGYDPDCQWLISAQEEGFLTFIFVYMSIALDTDFLRIGYSHNISQDTMVLDISGEGAPTSLTLNASKGWVTFTSVEGFWEGFVVEVYLTEKYGKYI